MKKRTSFQIFQSVVMALFLREVQTRFGTKRLGYFWAILDPLMKVIVFTAMKEAISTSTTPGIDYPVFLASSFLTYNFFMAVMMGSMNAFEANAALFNYKQVKPFDTLVSRFFLEFLIMCMAIIVFICFGLYFDLNLHIKDFNMVFLAVVWLGIFGFGMGLVFAVIGTFYETFKKVVGYMSMPLFFLSGLMYTLDSLPQIARDILSYNPLVHFMEMIHGNYFQVLNTNYVDYSYMFFWTILPLSAGLYFYKRSEKKILAS